MAKKATRKTAKKKANPSSNSSRAKTSSKKSSSGKAGSASARTARKKANGRKATARKAKAAARPKAAPVARKRKAAPSRKAARSSNDALSLGHASEDLFATQIIDELDAHHGIDISTIDIRVREGKATVRGLIADPDELEVIKDTLGEAGGITSMSVVVQVSSERREKDREIAHEIQDILDNEPDLAAQNIQVACVASKAVLRGTADSEMAKVKAGLLALRNGPAVAIRNRIVVTDGKKA